MATYAGLISWEVGFYEVMPTKEDFWAIGFIFDFKTPLFSPLKIALFSIIVMLINAYITNIKDKLCRRDFIDRLVHKGVLKIKQIYIPEKMTALYRTMYLCFSASVFFYLFLFMIESVIGNFVIDLQLQPTGESRYNYVFIYAILLMSTLSFIANLKFTFDNSNFSAMYAIFGMMPAMLYLINFAGGVIGGDIHYLSIDEAFPLRVMLNALGIALASSIASIIIVRCLCKLTTLHAEKTDKSEAKKNNFLFSKYEKPEGHNVPLKDTVKPSRFDFFIPIFILLFTVPFFGFAKWAVNGNTDVMNHGIIGGKQVVYRDGVFTHPENSALVEAFIEFTLGYPIIVAHDGDSIESLYMSAKREGLGEAFLLTVNKAQAINSKVLGDNADKIKSIALDVKHMPLLQYISYEITRTLAEVVDFERALAFHQMVERKEYQEAVNYIENEMAVYSSKTDLEKAKANYGLHSTYILFMIDDLNLAQVNKTDEIKSHISEMNKISKDKDIESRLDERKMDVSKIISLLN